MNLLYLNSACDCHVSEASSSGSVDNYSVGMLLLQLNGIVIITAIYWLPTLVSISEHF